MLDKPFFNTKNLGNLYFRSYARKCVVRLEADQCIYQYVFVNEFSSVSIFYHTRTLKYIEITWYIRFHVILC